MVLASMDPNTAASPYLAYQFGVSEASIHHVDGPPRVAASLGATP